MLVEKKCFPGPYDDHKAVSRRKTAAPEKTNERIGMVLSTVFWTRQCSKILYKTMCINFTIIIPKDKSQSMKNTFSMNSFLQSTKSDETKYTGGHGEIAPEGRLVTGRQKKASLCGRNVSSQGNDYVGGVSL